MRTRTEKESSVSQNELRPEECVGILVKHQSGTTRMIEIVSSTTGAAEKALVLPSEDPFPGFVPDPLGRILLFRLARPAHLSRLSYADNKLHSVSCVVCPRVLCRLIPSRFLHSSARKIWSLLFFDPRDVAFSFKCLQRYEFLIATSNCRLKILYLSFFSFIVWEDITYRLCDIAYRRHASYISRI